jgi:hypothetical protein
MPEKVGLESDDHYPVMVVCAPNIKVCCAKVYTGVGKNKWDNGV